MEGEHSIRFLGTQAASQWFDPRTEVDTASSPSKVHLHVSADPPTLLKDSSQHIEPVASRQTPGTPGPGPPDSEFLSPSHDRFEHACAVLG